MKKILLLLVFISLSVSLFAAYTYTTQFPHPYTGELYDYTITVNDDGTWTITLYDNTRTFTDSEISNGVYQTWVTDIILAMFPSSGGSLPVSRSFVSLNGSLNNTQASTSKMRSILLGNNTSVGDSSDSEEESEVQINVVPDVELLIFQDTHRYHIAAGIMGYLPEEYMEYYVKPWVEYCTKLDNSGNGFDFGLDVGYQGTAIVDSVVSGMGLDLSVSMNDPAFSTSSFFFNMGVQFNFGWFVSDELLIAAGGAYYFNLNETVLGHGYAAGLNVLSAISEELFVSAYAALSASVGGLILSSTDPIEAGLPVWDVGTSLGYYFSDSFYIELGFQYIMYDIDNIIGISLGSSYRF